MLGPSHVTLPHRILMHVVELLDAESRILDLLGRVGVLPRPVAPLSVDEKAENTRLGGLEILLQLLGCEPFEVAQRPATSGEVMIRWM